MQFIADELSESVFVSTNASPVNNPTKAYSSLSFHKSYPRTLDVQDFMQALEKEYGAGRITAIKDKILESVHYYNNALHILEQGRPAACIFTNDINPKSRALLLAAKKLDIPTIYIQHASVSKYFPPLAFDLALLDGEDTHSKYKEAGTVEGNIEYIGIPKFDSYYKFRQTKDSIDSIGICGNLLDEKDKLHELVIKIQQAFPSFTLSYRPHPRDNRTLSFPGKVAISDSKSELIFDFLKRQDLILAANTACHVEAAIMNIPSIYFELSDNLINDYYGYINHGLIEEAKTLSALLTLIDSYQKERPKVYTRAKYYSDTVGTTNEGRSGELAISYIQNFLSERRS